MPRFTANLSMLFTEVPLVDRPAAARSAGFDGLELQFPYELSAEEFKRAVDDSGLPLVLCNFPAGDFITGGTGNASKPGASGAFEDDLQLGLEYARVLQPQIMNCLSGRLSTDYSIQQSLDCFADNLRLTYRALDGLDIRLVTEAINNIDQPGFLLPDPATAIALLDRLDDCDIRLQFDIYHVQMMSFDLASNLTALMPRIGHIQFADVPGRHEPGTGDIDWQSLFRLIDQSDYQGYVGAEYLPAWTTAASLGWLAQSGFQ